jgi:hypothetical protein
LKKTKEAVKYKQIKDKQSKKGKTKINERKERFFRRQ